MSNIDDDVLERLEAEATVADAEPEELTLAVESDIEQKDAEVEELQEAVEEKESEIEELEEAVESKEEELSEMQEKVDVMAESYAEELSEHSDVMDKDDFLDRFEFEELQEKVDGLEGGSPSPAPNSGDAGAGFQSPNGDGGEGGEGEQEELSQKEELAAESFRDRARQTGNDYWNDIADDIENSGE